jgi:hypothetical protein
MKSAVEYFLSQTTPPMRQVFWFDTYSVNNGVVKTVDPDFDKTKEKTALERLDKPFNAAIGN